MFHGFKKLFSSNDKKPVMLSFILQRDDCSRLLGEFGEKYLDSCSKLAIVWKNGTEDIQIVTSDSLHDDEAAVMLLKSAVLVGNGHG